MKIGQCLATFFLIFAFFGCSVDSERSQLEEAQELADMFAEIERIALGVSCDEASDWAFTAYGNKACGGPAGYIAYATTIDVPAFLRLVSDYTQAEQNFNTAWNIISDCALQLPPSAITCENSVPVFVYE